MVRIKCNSCQEFKNMKRENYNSMLKRFGITRSFIFGMTHGLEAIVRGEPVGRVITDEETEKAFLNWYVCRDCKNNKKETIKITESITRILNLKKSENDAPKHPNRQPTP